MLACDVLSFEAKASNSARPASRGMRSLSHRMANSIGTVICFAVSTRASGHIMPKTVAVILGSTATSGSPIVVPRPIPT
ncbi:hypothetical protein [Kitasatospora sp. NPDC088548]|uniref:hypothetical protein n=1 Tax=Kitasatospora sp. NPDC088548 TaxID=3364075 RepID=UPI00380FFF0C